MNKKETFDEIFEVIIQEKSEKNKKDVDRQIDVGPIDPTLDLQITKRVKRNKITYDKYVDDLKTCDSLRWEVMVDPSRQNPAEEVALKMLSENFGFKNVKKLPPSGPDAYYIIDGEFLTGLSKDDLDSYSDSKPCSIDFYCEYHEYIFYIYHKYVKEAGGTQSKQYKDALNFIEHSNSNTEVNTIFMAICDGKFFSAKPKRSNSKLDKLSKACRKNNVKAFNLDGCDLENYLKTLDPQPQLVN